MIPTEPPQDLEPVESRHRDVEEDEIRALAPNTLERLFSVEGLGHGVPLVLEVVRQHAENLALVVDDKDPAERRVHPALQLTAGRGVRRNSSLEALLNHSVRRAARRRWRARPPRIRRPRGLAAEDRRESSPSPATLIPRRGRSGHPRTTDRIWVL